MAETISLLTIPSPLNSTTALSAINNNFTTIQNVFADVLSLSGVAPNQMQSNLDMNSNQIINLTAPATTNSPARLIDVVSNPSITVPPVGTSGAVVGLLNANNTYSGTSTFTGNVNLNGPISIAAASITLPASVLGNATFSGNNTYSGTSAFTNNITATNNSLSALTITDGSNPLKLGTVTSGAGQFWAYNLTQTTSLAQLNYQPTSANPAFEIYGNKTRLSFRASRASTTGVNPQIVISDLDTFGVPVLNGANQAGIGLVGNGVQGTAAFTLNIASLGGATTGAWNSCAINIWGTSAAGDTQNLITFFNGTGTSSWNGTQTATQAGSRLGEICGAGVAGDGQFTQTETWSINGYADANFGGTHTDGNYTAYSNIIFRNCYTANSPELTSGGFYAPGTFALGAWPASGNNFTGTVGTMTMKNVTSTPGTMAGAGVLFVNNGALQYRGSSGTLTTIASA